MNIDRHADRPASHSNPSDQADDWLITLLRTDAEQTVKADAAFTERVLLALPRTAAQLAPIERIEMRVDFGHIARSAATSAAASIAALVLIAHRATWFELLHQSLVSLSPQAAVTALVPLGVLAGLAWLSYQTVTE